MTRRVRLGKAWNDVEVNALKTYFPIHGSGWEGWSEVLPDRSSKAISVKAASMGIVTSRQHNKTPERQRFKREHPERRSGYKGPDPMEGRIMRMMADGMTPSEIDAEMKWRPGKAKRVITERWAREKGL